jgi:hypothetical protein
MIVTALRPSPVRWFSLRAKRCSAAIVVAPWGWGGCFQDIHPTTLDYMCPKTRIKLGHRVMGSEGYHPSRVDGKFPGQGFLHESNWPLTGQMRSGSK